MNFYLCINLANCNSIVTNCYSMATCKLRGSAWISKMSACFSFLRAKAAMLSARLSHRNSVRLSVRPYVRHTGGSVKNGAS